MVVVALDGRFGFLETNIIETRKRCSTYVFDRVIRNEEMLLPAHKNVIRVG